MKDVHNWWFRLAIVFAMWLIFILVARNSWGYDAPSPPFCRYDGYNYECWYYDRDACEDAAGQYSGYSSCRDNPEIYWDPEDDEHDSLHDHRFDFDEND